MKVLTSSCTHVIVHYTCILKGNIFIHCPAYNIHVHVQRTKIFIATKQVDVTLIVVYKDILLIQLQSNKRKLATNINN